MKPNVASTISKILKNETYPGHTVNCQTTTVSFRDKRVIKRPKSEQYRYENTHEIIRTFISKIVIHEKSAKHCKSATQQIDIYFTHIGMLHAV